MMIRVLIVDDDTIVRTAVKLLTDWRREGIDIIGEAANGKQALKILRSTPADVLLTDIKMPIMDGLSLLEALPSLPNPPACIVLSAYDEFPLVRRAFTLGAVDYLQKSEMTVEGLKDCIQKAATNPSNLVSRTGAEEEPSPAERLKEAVLSESGLEEVIPVPCLLACVELDDFESVKQRFAPHLDRDLVLPLLDLAYQTTNAAEQSVFCSLSPSRYLFVLPCREGQTEQVHALCSRLAKTWKTYLNLSVSIGLSDLCVNHTQGNEALNQCMQNVSMRLVLGTGRIFTAAQYEIFDLPLALDRAEQLHPLIAALKAGNGPLLNEERSALFAPCYGHPPDIARQQALAVVYQVALMLATVGTSLQGAFSGEEFDYDKRTSRLETAKDCEIWTANLLRHVMDYLIREFDPSGKDVMEQAERYILDHYHETGLNVKEVADAVGFSEKYFSTRFNRFFQTSVSAYVNTLRIAKAKELLQQTDLKIYQIAETAGFANTEHFIRVFRAKEGMPPSAYKKQNRTKCQ